MQKRITRGFLPPERINVDNGAPWGGQGGPADTPGDTFELQSLCTSANQRKDGRFHRTLKAEVLQAHTFAGLVHAQNHFERRRHIYNHQRSHEALNMDSPAQRYRVSARPMPSVLPEIESRSRHRAQSAARRPVKPEGREIRVSKALGGHGWLCVPKRGLTGGLCCIFVITGLAKLTWMIVELGVNFVMLKLLPMSQYTCYLCLWSVHASQGRGLR